MVADEVKIKIDRVRLGGILKLPDKTRGLVIFAHGSGSSRLSPRNKLVADFLNEARFATLLFDLLTAEEDEIYANRFNIPLLADRLASATAWALEQTAVKHLPIGYFGASTGSAAALIAAAKLGATIQAVASRGGRPDLAEDVLGKVPAPTLLIVGGHDPEVIELNQSAYEQLTCIKELKIVAGATHLFEEPGALEEVSRLAADWFSKYLRPKISAP